MNKTNYPSQVKQMALNSELSEHPLIDWISNNKQYILWGLAVLFAVTIFTYRFVSSRALQAEGDYFQAQTEFSRFQNATREGQITEAVDHSNKLATLLTLRPELQAKYDGLTAQYLLIDQQTAPAQSIAQRIFDRVKDDSINFYEKYAQTSLLINEGRYQEAATEAQQLKLNLDASPSSTYGPTLYVFNLIRLAMLYQQLGQPNEEKKAWDDLLQYKGDLQAVLATQQLFQEGNLSLSHYAEDRKAVNN